MEKSNEEELELEITISEEDSEMIVKLKHIIEKSSHKLPNTLQ